MSNKTFITWEKIQEDCKNLAEQLSDFNFSCIVGIANGGMIPATLLAKYLKVDKLLSANLKSYQEDKPRDGAHSERAAMTTGMEGDFETGNVRYKARERYSFGFSDWRGIYGSPGA